MIRDMHRRRQFAAARCQPLHTGKRDPDFFAPQRRPKSPEVTMYALSIGGTTTLPELRAAWLALPDARPTIEAAAAVLTERAA